MGGSFLMAFIWAVRNGQFDDDHTPSLRILFDDRPKSTPALHKGDNNYNKGAKIISSHEK